MNVDDYLDNQDPDGTRLKGHRIWLNDLLYEVVFNYRTVEELAGRFPTLRMDEIYACLLYFETHREACLKNLTEHVDWSRSNVETHAQESREVMARLRQRKLQQMMAAGGMMFSFD
jgi:uncharacterized protein (DUF433 family)